MASLQAIGKTGPAPYSNGQQSQAQVIQPYAKVQIWLPSPTRSRRSHVLGPDNKWAEAEAQEMKSFLEFGVFKDLGKGGKPPEGYKKVKLIAVYNVKHDGWHKTRIVTGGHLTDIPMESVYSGVVSLRGIQLLVFLAELNGLQAWATDISSAYLQARTKEKLYLIAGPEFGDTPCLCTRHYTAYAPQGFDGMNA